MLSASVDRRLQLNILQPEMDVRKRFGRRSKTGLRGRQPGVTQGFADSVCKSLCRRQFRLWLRFLMTATIWVSETVY